MLSDKVFLTLLSPRASSGFHRFEPLVYREVVGWRTGLFSPSPFFTGIGGGSGPRRAFAVCVLIARADVQDRRGVLP